MIALRCEKHPRYTGMGKPAVDCGACWFLWSTIDDVVQYNKDSEDKIVVGFPKRKRREP